MVPTSRARRAPKSSLYADVPVERPLHCKIDVRQHVRRVLRPAVFAALLVTSEAGLLEAGFGFRKPITLDWTRVSGGADLYNFPVLVSLANDPDLQANVASGLDIQFRAADGISILDHEIERYEPATGTLVAWVRIPRLRFDADTLIYIYYGDPSASCSLANSGGVWEQNFVGVWHLAEDPSGVAPQIRDSTPFINHGTSGGGMTTADQVSGKIGGAIDFDGTNDMVDAGSSAVLDDLGPLTVSAWIQPRTSGPGAPSIVSKYGATSTGRWFIEIDDTAPEVDTFEFNKNFSTGSASRHAVDGLVSYGAWQQVAVTWTRSELGSGIHIYQNGAEVAYQLTTDGTLPFDSDAAYPLIIGNRGNGTTPFDGLIDEVRLSRTVRSPGWIQTEFDNQNLPTKDPACSNGGFACVGLQQALPGAFTNVSAASGLATTGNKDGGLAWGDFNNDGCLDALVNTNSAARGSRLYLQDGSGSCAGTFTDVTACLAPGLAAAVRERSSIWGDIDNDGDLDFARNAGGATDIEIYRNNGSAPSGCGVAWSVFGSAGAPSQVLDAASIPFTFNSEGLGFLDYDADGDLDLLSDQNGPIAIFQNTGGTFAYVAVPGLPTSTAGNGDYIAVTDIEPDGDVDILDRRSGSPDLFLNNANAGTFSAGTFDEAAANGNKGGAAFCDFDDDSDFDLFWTDAGADPSGPNQIWEQTGVGTGSFAARGFPVPILGDIDGVACGDVDNDGDLDLVVTSDGNDHLFRNEGGFAFTDVSPPAFGVSDGEAAAFGDYDRDGDLDLLMNQDTANELWRNETTNNNYLMVRALHDAGVVDRDAIGATVRLLDCGLSRVSGVREVNGGRGHGSQDPAPVHMGLSSCGATKGPNSRYVVEVRFVGGAVVQKAVQPSMLGSYQMVTVRDTDSDDLTACTTAVELLSFEARGADGAVVLEWETGSEIDNLGFHLYRRFSREGPFVRLTSRLIPGLGSSPQGARYQYVDEGVENDVTAFYELEDIETTGRVQRHGPVAATPRAGVPVGRAAGESASLPATIVYGEPARSSLRIERPTANEVLLELRTEGFYAVPLADGSTRIEVPGYEAADGAVVLPARRFWIEAPPGRNVAIELVREEAVESFTGFRPPGAPLSEVVMHPTGTVRLRRSGRRPEATELTPATAGRIVQVAFQGSAKKVLVEMAPLRWEGKSERLFLSRRVLARLRFRGRNPSELVSGKSHSEPRSHVSRPVLVQLLTVERGLHRVDFRDVFGRRRGAVPAGSLRLSRLGTPVGVHLEPRRDTFGPGSSLYFLGEGAAANPYGEEAVYELETGVSGLMMPVSGAPPSPGTPAFAWQRLELEENHLYQAALVDAVNPWLWDVVFSGTRKTVALPAKDLAGGAGATLRVFLNGGSDLPPSPDHHVRLWINGSLVGEDRWNAKRPRALAAPIPAGILRDGDNVLEIENVGDTEALYSMVFLDRLVLEYPRSLQAEGGRFEARFDEGGSATVSGLPADALVLDVTEDVPRWHAPSPAAPGASLVFSADAGRTYLAVDRNAVLRPAVRRPLSTRLRNSVRSADYVVIGPSEFLPAARPLLRRRERQGLTVASVSLEAIASEFGFGESTPDAIRSFLTYAYHHWSEPSPRYVLLLGDGTYDFKDYLQTGPERRRVPPMMVKTQFLWTASDPAYAAVNGEDGLADLAIGRLPAASVQEVERLVAKILTWEASPEPGLEGRVVLVTDNPDAAGNFETDAEEITDTFLRDRDVETIHLRALGSEQARARILESFDRGAALVSYVGHGGIDLWADERLFQSSAIASLSEQPKQPVVLAMNCLNGYFHFPYFDSLAEALVMAERKGAIAVVAPSGLSLHDPAHRLHRALMRELTEGAHLRLGDAFLAAQRAFASSDSFPELLTIYHLLGDPALEIKSH